MLKNLQNKKILIKTKILKLKINLYLKILKINNLIKIIYKLLKKIKNLNKIKILNRNSKIILKINHLPKLVRIKMIIIKVKINRIFYKKVPNRMNFLIINPFKIQINLKIKLKFLKTVNICQIRNNNLKAIIKQNQQMNLIIQMNN